MNRKHAIALIIVTVVTVTFAALALGGHVSKGLKVFLLKSQGGVIAELRVRAGTQWEVTSRDSSGRVEYNQTTGTLSASGGVVLKISTGMNSVTVTADEVEGVPEAK